MSSRVEVVWICCPNGFTADRRKARASVFVAPRLSTDAGAGTVADFPVMVDWPTHLAATTLSAGLRPRNQAGSPLPATIVSPAADSRVWRAIFPASTPVTSFAGGPDLSQRTITSYPATRLAATIDAVYEATLVASVAAPPLQLSVPASDQPPVATPDPVDSLQSLFAPLDSAAGLAAPATEGSALAELVQAQQVRRARTANPPSTSMGAPPDFHQLITSVGDHPALLRLLGLVIDIEFDFTTPPGDSFAYVLPSDSPDRLDLCALTALLPDGFTARPRADGTPAGFEPLTPPDWVIEQTDVDSMLEKTQAMLAALGSDPAGRAAPPARRTIGLALALTGRADAIRRELQRKASFVDSLADGGSDIPAIADGAAVLDATDLRSGYRLDILDEAIGSWRSLHARQVRYNITGVGPMPDASEPPISDEGYLQDVLTAVAGGADGDLFVHEYVATWRGWSLSAPYPVDGQRAAPPPTSPPPAVVPDISAAPGTLPALRFGRQYRMRMRTVDLAGNGLVGDVTSPDGVDSVTVRFLRQEPVPPPVVAPDAETVAAQPHPGPTEIDFGPGAGLHRIVLRSDGSSPSPSSSRMLIAPAGSVQLAELHGKLDDGIGTGRSASRGPSRAMLARAGAALTLPVGDAPPYLPDPMAAGVAFLGLPGQPADQPLQVLFAAPTWDTPRPLRLAVVEGPRGTPPVIDAAAATVTVTLARGQSATVQVASMLADPSAMALLATDGRAGASRSASDDAAVQASAKASRNTLITPWQEIELIDAVPQSLTPPGVDEPEAERGWRDTDTGLTFSGFVDPDTAAQLSITASWTDQVDDPAAPAPTPRTRSALAWSWPRAALSPPGPDFDLAVPTGSAPVQADSDQSGLRRLPFGDTRHHAVTLTPSTVPPYPECFTNPPVPLAGADVAFEVLNSAPPPPPKVLSVVTTSALVTDGVPPRDGETIIIDDPSAVAHRRDGGIRVYLDRPWNVTGDDELLGVVVGHGWEGLPNETPDNIWHFDPDNAYAWYASHVGQDPLRQSADVPPLTAAQFRNAELTDQVQLRELARAAVPDRAATIVAYRPVFDPVSGHWVCDIDLDLGDAYFPFVRLALVRYQPKSLRPVPDSLDRTPDACVVSPVVTTQAVQPLPQRTLSVIPSADSIKLTLSGPGYGVIPDPLTLQFPDTVDVPPRVHAQLYWSDPGPVVEWTPVLASDMPPGASPTVNFDRPGNFWVATLARPTAHPGRTLRVLVIEEDAVPLDAGQDPNDGLGARVIYFDAVDLEP
jgi:hypothetical protein